MNTTKTIKIADREIAPTAPAYFIAELSANHLNDFDRARRLVEAAAEAGADAIKLQTYTADTITIDSDLPQFRIGGGTLWDGQRLYDLYSSASTPWEWHAPLFELAQQLGLHAFSSPFDPSAVDFLAELDVPAYKIASFELVDLPLIRYAAEKGRPIILSTGMATLADIERAVRTVRETGNDQIALLRTSSGYPARPEEMRLANIPLLAELFSVPIGLSDHTLESAVPVAARALGACIIEKHLILDRSEGGPDAAFSLEPQEFAEMVRQVRLVEKAIAETGFGPTECEQSSLTFRRSLHVVRDVAQGEPLTPENVRSIRPSGGLHPRYLPAVLGARARRPLRRGEALSWDMVELDAVAVGPGSTNDD